MFQTDRQTAFLRLRLSPSGSPESGLSSEKMNPFWRTPIRGVAGAVLRSYKPKLAVSKPKESFAFVADMVVVRT